MIRKISAAKKVNQTKTIPKNRVKSRSRVSSEELMGRIFVNNSRLIQMFIATAVVIINTGFFEPLLRKDPDAPERKAPYAMQKRISGRYFDISIYPKTRRSVMKIFNNCYHSIRFIIFKDIMECKYNIKSQFGYHAQQF